jgi:hypothetical protein
MDVEKPDGLLYRYIRWDGEVFILSDSVVEVGKELASNVIADNDPRDPDSVILERFAQGVVHVHLSLSFLKIDNRMWDKAPMPRASCSTNSSGLELVSFSIGTIDSLMVIAVGSLSG